MRPTNVLEMMKEWKNNPESDEENKKEENNESCQEKLERYQQRGNVPAVNNTSNEKEGNPAKQVGRTIVSFIQTVKYPSQHWEQFLQLFCCCC